MSCYYRKKYRGATATGIVTISSGDESSLASALATTGPIATYVDASSSMFQVSVCIAIYLIHSLYWNNSYSGTSLIGASGNKEDSTFCVLFSP